MSNVLADWVRDIRGNALAKTSAAEAALSREIEELRQAINDCQDSQRLKAQRLELEAEVRRMGEQRETLEEELSAAREDIANRRRAAAATDLDAIEAALAGHRVERDYETLHAASHFLGASSDPIRVSPEELRRTLEGSEKVARVRSALAKILKDAHDEASQQQQFIDRARDLESRADELDAEIAELQRALAVRHQVGSAVLNTLEGLAPHQAARLRHEFLEPRTRDAEVEGIWGLPDDVLKMITGGGE